ncbi:DUF29 domain-containing protein [Endozoicomonas sp. 8E]|uniref:DUF29 domain-containing protein n=1 Tax=Endozoicomonas sp. 8E TaxID=3035692 RepID=UPI0029395240|nr:DUF29 domain-containing protein [Endozoicomonas sp. 8E]WOG28610.1 DUF29 domain-containing protein [Endozoicomonas sp. 8E]
MENLYDTDFYTWSLEQAELIRQGRFDELDLDNLIEEVEDMGKARHRALESCLEQLLMHLLKWQMQASKDDFYDMKQWFRSWLVSMGKQRDAVHKELKKNPGLHNKLDEIFLDAYDYARKLAAREMQCKPDAFPPECPWTYEQVMTEDWLPEADHE